MTEIDAHYWFSPGFTLVCAAVFGLMVGSFLNVVIHRLPVMMQARWEAEAAQLIEAEPAAEAAGAARAVEPAGIREATGASRAVPTDRTPGVGIAEAASAAPAKETYNLAVPRSRCPHCGHAITAAENIPVLSWLWLRGRCSACGARISPRYPMVEILSGTLAFLSIGHYGLTVAGCGAALLCFALIALTFIDVDTQLLPDDITLPLLWIGLLLNLGGVFAPLPDAVLGAMVGYLLLWSIYWIFKLVTGKEGMGYGDFKLLAALGAWFGWQAIPAIILLASMVGAVVGICLMVFARHGRDVPIPFGPYLAGAGALTLFFSKPLMALYGLA
ncbi:MAG TPA: A24 family peptidase [Lautropia sp.]|nr:A24 family peptidase [Lautropia sp.]